MSDTVIPFRRPATYVIIPSDSVDLSTPMNAIFIGGAAGNLVLKIVGDASVNTYAVAAGQIVTGVGSIQRVDATSTTATGIIGIA